MEFQLFFRGFRNSLKLMFFNLHNNQNRVSSLNSLYVDGPRPSQNTFQKIFDNYNYNRDVTSKLNFWSDLNLRGNIKMFFS